ncbi:hypothetical protein ABOM_002901 [Aspergillus bombycis]|uniref:Zn(2)-C6 fungal-type domain-containing protein n=1 Tax=Aspergillus bombycis TaxID=109264 RepID=A0A1F8A8M8_9EURO|nr:hypothetical protein ABOM_002901 [Aspergillus bombycis]OGM48041.1 hypothetical protein ABOM_002901 [Aspergillus bombycis]
MCAQTSQGGPSRKRRRQAVVCTECRRRKIACDRNTPCAQCIQSNSPCTYYNSYNSYSASADFSSDQDNSVKPQHRRSSSTAVPAIHNFGPRMQLPNPTTVNYHDTFTNAADMNTLLPTSTTALDTGATGWFDTNNLGPLTAPLSINLETPPIPFTDVGLDGVTSMAESTAMDAVQTLSSPSQHPAKVVFLKSRLYGPSHWMTLFRKYEQQGLFNDIINVISHGEGYSVLQQCKQLAQSLKARSCPTPQLLSRPPQELMPSREVSDRLVQLYLRTFESVLRVLHIPSFQEDYVQYWSNPQAASESLVLQILLVLAIGTCFYQDPLSSEGAGGGPTLHDQSTQWIHAAHIRLTAPFRKRHLDLRGVQNQCLLVIALLTNTNAVGGDLASITTASLIQSGMAIGLHLGPSQLPVSPLDAEIRRRLWATMLELAVQASLDSGMPPVISAEAYDSCELPSNLDDSQISESSTSLPASQPMTTFTQSSIQCALLRSLPIRLKIAQTLSRFRTKLLYDAARSMGAELTAALRETSELIDSFVPTPPSAFQVQLQDLLARRFLLILHAQFGHKASSDVNYHFSRTVCLDCSLLLLSPSPNSSTNEATGRRDGNITSSSLNDYTNLRLYGDGLFKNVFLAASLTVCTELLLQLREDSSPAASSLSRRELIQTIEDATSLTRRRILRGETSVKLHAFLACVLAKIGTSKRRLSLQHKPPTEQVVANAAKRTLDSCSSILEARLRRMETRPHPGPIVNAPLGSHLSFPELTPLDTENGDGLGRRGAVSTILERSSGTSPSLDDGSDAWSFPAWENETASS